MAVRSGGVHVAALQLQTADAAAAAGLKGQRNRYSGQQEAGLQLFPVSLRRHGDVHV